MEPVESSRESQPEGFLFVESPLSAVTEFPLAACSGVLQTKVAVTDSRKERFDKELYPHNLEMCHDIVQKLGMTTEEVFPPVTNVIFLDFHGLINCPIFDKDRQEIPDHPKTLKHMGGVLETLALLRRKGVGAMILSYVGKLTDSHASLLAFSSQKLFQSIFVGVIFVFERIRKKRTNWGKGRVLSIAQKYCDHIVFADDDPDNLLDANLWLEGPYSLIRFADPQLTEKAARYSKSPSIVATTLQSLREELVRHF